eukprot:gnl/TRDRNA2_/TRDRNA2_104431_c0_seq1.p1 gnl/TRDRNA2_/TRDRNA2_104431_c0~~gnl/TRDRNA2_/TRDRNA2_104431_c0_seq1.p1  ORF type:complete len:115 (-),score=16.63 gnl/TRDRNA2_/TRDRNA2_104431_c0_seq1:115-459(-)
MLQPLPLGSAVSSGKLLTTDPGGETHEWVWQQPLNGRLNYEIVANANLATMNASITALAAFIDRERHGKIAQAEANWNLEESRRVLAEAQNAPPQRESRGGDQCRNAPDTSWRS